MGLYITSKMGSLVFSVDVTVDRINKTNSEMYRALLSAQIQTNDAKMTGWKFTVQMDDFKHTVKTTKNFQKSKNVAK